VAECKTIAHSRRQYFHQPKIHSGSKIEKEHKIYFFENQMFFVTSK
jgi:hypothetical protein